MSPSLGQRTIMSFNLTTNFTFTVKQQLMEYVIQPGLHTQRNFSI